jgi:hypothetical protein
MSRNLFVFLSICIAGCAAIQPPPGGKEDKTPPMIDSASVFPAMHALNVSRSTKFHFEFAHNIDRNSFMSAISVTPYIDGVVKYNWSGYDEVTVSLPDTLRANMTYIVTLSKDLKTFRGAPLNAPYQLIFSTGNQIDTGMISGTVLPPVVSANAPDLKNISIFGYDLSVINPDTLEVNKVRPDYMTQPSDKGAFDFKAMKPGHRYRLFAVIDEFRNKVYDPGIDSYGMPSSDVTLEGNSLAGVRIRMMPKADTSKPELQDWEMQDVYHLRVRFSKGIDSASVRIENFSFKDSITSSPVSILSAYRENIEHKPGAVMLFLSTPVRKSNTYQLVASHDIKDAVGNHLDSLQDRIWVKPSEPRDTFAPPKFSGLPYIDSARNVIPEVDNVFSFSDAVDTAAFENGLQLLDSTGHPVTINYKWIDGIRIRAVVSKPLMPHAWYKFIFQNTSVKSPGGIHFGSTKDTTLICRFFTDVKTEYGTIKGTVSVADSALAKGHIVIRVASSGNEWTRILQLPAGKRDYMFTDVPRNHYHVQAWLTDRADGEYQGGSPIPLKFAFPSGDYPDDIDVRPKWAVEHVDITLQ